MESIEYLGGIAMVENEEEFVLDPEDHRGTWGQLAFVLLGAAAVAALLLRRRKSRQD